MSTHQQIVVAYDYSESAVAAMQRGIELACADPRNVLHFAVIIDPRHSLAALPSTGPLDAEYAARVQADLSGQLRRAFDQRVARGEVHFFAHARFGKPAEEILQLAAEVGADLILMGSNGRTGLRRAILGSVAEHVVREAGCPVLVERAKTYAPVDLLEVVTVEPSHKRWVAPLRFSYQQSVLTRPNDWPLN